MDSREVLGGGSRQTEATVKYLTQASPSSMLSACPRLLGPSCKRRCSLAEFPCMQAS